MTYSNVFLSKIRSFESDSLICRYYSGIQEASKRISPVTGGGFAPAFEYPPLNDRWEEYFSVARASSHDLGCYHGFRISLLDLMKNPATGTTKTTASLLMIARAIHHINTTGESILLFTPSSGNKAIALRDAVARAIELNLVSPTKLRIASLTPDSSRYKLRRNILSEDTVLQKLNPMLLYPGDQADYVKVLGKQFIERVASLSGERIWYSLDIGNYKVADACRAYFEYEFSPPSEGRRRLHAHAVSSAYGLLGFQHGIDTMASLGISHTQPAFLLVQHLATSDMVRHYLEAAGIEERIPVWTSSNARGIYTQESSSHFPAETWDPNENFEPTFYTHNPPTAPEMSGLMLKHGGSAIVVSFLECLKRYGESRYILRQSDQVPPLDPRGLAEWSLIMGITGILNSIDRGLLSDVDDIVLHGSGMYVVAPNQLPSQDQFKVVNNVDEVASHVLATSLS